jgi:hypothetical protein
MKIKWKIILGLVLGVWSFGIQTGSVQAAPYFFITGEPSIINGYLYTYNIYLYTTTDTVTAAQTVLNFDTNKINATNFSTLNSRCTFWAPPDPSLSLGNQTTPFFSNTKLVIACGFSNPGYTSVNGQGDLIIKMSLTPVAGALGNSSLTFTDTLFRYIGTAVTPGQSVDLNLTVYPSTESANPTATPYPSPTPINPATFKASDMDIVDLASGSSSTVNSQSLSLNTLPVNLLNPTIGLSALNQLDNRIPPPGELTPRPSVSPYITLPPDRKSEPSIGEVLSVQSLKELLLPGKSEADQKIVIVNLLSTLAFIVILAILIWRLIILSRINKIKYRHMKELIGGELSALESKLGNEVNQETRSDISAQIEQLKDQLDEK